MTLASLTNVLKVVNSFTITYRKQINFHSNHQSYHLFILTRRW